MTRKKAVKDDRVAGTKNGDFSGFVNHEMTRDEKNQYEQWSMAVDDASLLDYLQELVDNGYKISLKYDGRNKTYQCSLTCSNPNHDDFGLVLTARAPDMFNLLRVAVFKHFVLLRGDWLTFQNTVHEERQWG